MNEQKLHQMAMAEADQHFEWTPERQCRDQERYMQRVLGFEAGFRAAIAQQETP